MELAGATWNEVAATDGGRVLVIPLGSLEQHGPHLPLDTDTRIAVALAERLAAGRLAIAVAPPLGFGASGEHGDFPGTLLINHDVLSDFLVELVRSARAAFRGVVLLSGHGGNAEGLGRAVARCHADGDDVLAWGVRVDGGDAHAGRTETSLMLALAPEAVHLDRAVVGCTEPLDTLLPKLRAEGVRPISSSGVLGDPRGATAEEGRQLLTTMVGELATAVAARWPEGATR